MVTQLVLGFWQGFWAPLRALKVIAFSPRLLVLLAIPLAINLGLYVIFFTYGSAYLATHIAALTAYLATMSPAWLVGISAIALNIIGWLALALLAALSFTFVSGALLSPFNDAVSRVTVRIHAEKLGVTLPAPLELSIVRTVWLELKRLTVLIVGGLATLLLGLVPFLQIPALAIGALLVSFEYFGFPLSQRTSSLAEVGLFVGRNKAVCLGFGSFLLLLMALPFTAIVYIPLAVVGGSLLYVELTKPA